MSVEETISSIEKCLALAKNYSFKQVVMASARLGMNDAEMQNMTLFGTLFSYLHEQKKEKEQLQTKETERIFDFVISEKEKSIDIPLAPMIEWCQGIKKEELMSIPPSELKQIELMHEALSTCRTNIRSLDSIPLTLMLHPFKNIILAYKCATTSELPPFLLQNAKINGQAILPAKSFETQIQEKLDEAIKCVASKKSDTLSLP